MFELDFISVVIGYVAGILLCYHTAPMFFVHDDD
jgi:hypothetical protein